MIRCNCNVCYGPIIGLAVGCMPTKDGYGNTVLEFVVVLPFTTFFVPVTIQSKRRGNA